MVKDALPSRIRDELRFSHEDTSHFEGLKRAILQIDNDYWKRHLEEKKKFSTSRATTYAPSRIPRQEWRPTIVLTEGHPTYTQPSVERTRPSTSRIPTSSLEHSNTNPTTILGPDSRLTPAERQRRLSLGLCMCCGQPGHLARACPHQHSRLLGGAEGRATQLGLISREVEPPKKDYAVNSPPGEPTA